MKRAGAGWLSAVVRRAGVSRATRRSGPDAVVNMRRRFLLELQWRGRGGKFRHLAVRPPVLRRVTGAFGIIAVVALAIGVGGTFSAGTDRPLPHYGVGGILREHTELKARHDALSERAFDLAEQLYARVELGRRMIRTAGTTGVAWRGQCPRPPARDAGDEAIFVWLSAQGTRLEAIGNELTAGRVETGVKQASARTPVSAESVPARSAAMVFVAVIGSTSN